MKPLYQKILSLKKPLPNSHKKFKRYIKERYPSLFKRPYRPMKIGIRDDILARHPVERRLVTYFLSHHTSKYHYLKAIAEGEHRYGLDGEQSELSQEHKQAAAERMQEVAARRAELQHNRRWARRALSQRGTP